jgi:hypothetical protein
MGRGGGAAHREEKREEGKWDSKFETEREEIGAPGGESERREK